MKPWISTALGALLATGAVTTAQAIDVVRYLSQETDPAVVAIQREWVNSFTAANPGTDIILESAPAGVINQRIATFVQAGAPLDVIHSDPGTAARLAAEGLLAPLDDVVEALGGREAFLPNRLIIINDRVYGINQAAAAPRLFYRRDLFEQAGIAPPTTWDEVRAAAEALHSRDVIGIALAGGENRMTTIMASTMLWQNCWDFFDRDLNLILDHPRAHEAAAFYADLLQFSAPDAPAWAFNEPPESFWSGRSAMVLHWHALDLMMRQNPALVENVGIAPVTMGRMQATQTGGRFLAVFAESPTVEVGKKWIQHVFSPENAAMLTGISPLLYPPATEGAMEALRTSDAATVQAYGDLLFDLVYPDARFGFSEILQAGGLDTESCTLGTTDVVNPFISVLWNSNLYARAIQQIAFEGRDPAEAVGEAHRLLEEQVATARREMSN